MRAKKLILSNLYFLIASVLFCSITTGQTQDNGRKKNTLTKLVGTHKLTALNAFTGAHTIIDYYTENGKWIIPDGEVTKNVLAQFQSMKIIVEADLSIRISCGGRDYIKIPFQEGGFKYDLQNSPNSYSNKMPANLSKNTTFIDDILYLYAKDKMEFAELNDINLIQMAADVLVLKYNSKSNAFELNMFLGECCDSATYTFN